MKKYIKYVVGICVVMFVATSQVQAQVVTFNPNTGTGFVDIAPVQEWLNLNNGQMRKRAQGARFIFNQADVFTGVCNYSELHTYFADYSFEVNFLLSKGKGNQLVGYLLNGFKDYFRISNPFVLGESCPDGVWTEVNSSSSGDLILNFGDQSTSVWSGDF